MAVTRPCRVAGRCERTNVALPLGSKRRDSQLSHDVARYACAEIDRDLILLAVALGVAES